MHQQFRLQIGKFLDTLSAKDTWTQSELNSDAYELVQDRITTVSGGIVKDIDLQGGKEIGFLGGKWLNLLADSSESMQKWDYEGNNRIVNIQIISKLNSNQLQILQLDSNNITRIKPLRKCRFWQLKQLSLCDNPIQDVEMLSQMHFPVLNYLVLECFDGKCMGQDVVWLLKCQGFCLMDISLTGEGRIWQKNRIEMLRSFMPDAFVEVDSFSISSDDCINMGTSS